MLRILRVEVFVFFWVKGVFKVLGFSFRFWISMEEEGQQQC